MAWTPRSDHFAGAACDSCITDHYVRRSSAVNYITTDFPCPFTAFATAFPCPFTALSLPFLDLSLQFTAFP